MYYYMEEMKKDVQDYINENYDLAEFDSREEFEERLNEDAWMSDSITGNASGSYFFNTWKAEEAIAHNWDLLEDALNEFGWADQGVDPIEKGAEWCDVLIRCYLLSQVIAETLDDLDYEFEKDDEAEAEEA